MTAARAAILLATIALLSSCPRATTRPAGILLITLDTTRADHLGCYGDAQAATPHLDALAREGVRFDQAISAVPTTLPSHATMFTGLYPPRHGVRYNGMFRLGDASVTVAEQLRAAGYFTAAVPAAFPVTASTGLGQGFDSYRDLFSEPGAARLPQTASRPAADVTRLGLEEIQKAGGRPFFLWLHYYDAHYPYEPPFPFSSTYRAHPYDGEIASVDQQLGTLFEGIKRAGLWDRIAVIVVGDHGEGLYEHGERMHSELVYESTLRVPLLVRAPGFAGGAVVAPAVSLADIAPTILDLAALPVPADLDGVSLTPALKGKKLSPRTLYFETLAGALSFGWSPIEGIRRGKWKLIRGAVPELYDLERDPDEKDDLARTETAVVAELGEELRDDVDRWKVLPTSASATAVPADPDALARLASLGYVGGTALPTKAGGRNPKDVVHLESELLLIQDLMVAKQYRKVLNAVPDVLKDDPGNRMVLQSAAEASAELGDLDAAERYAREVTSRYPESLPGVVTLGRLSVARKNFPAAEATFRDGLTRFPDEPVLVYSLALTLIAEGRAKDAEPLVAQALSRPDSDPGFDVLKGVCRAMAGDEAGAHAALAQALARGYKGIATLRTEPLLAPLRKIKGFETLVTTPPTH